MIEKVELYIPGTLNPRLVNFSFCDAETCSLNCGRKINHSRDDFSADLSRYCANFKQDIIDKEK